MNTILDIETNEIYKPDELLNKWRQEALSFSSSHDKYSKEYGRKSKILTFISILFSSVVGITSFVQTEQWTAAIVGSISLLSAMIQSLTKYLKFESLEVEHKQLAIKYYNLADEILYELSDKKDEELKDVLTDIKFKMENMLKVSPNGIN